MSHTTACALDPNHTHAEELVEHDDADEREHAHGLVDRFILRSRAGIRAVSWSLGILTVTALAQARYSRIFLQDKRLIILQRGSRREMLNL